VQLVVFEKANGQRELIRPKIITDVYGFREDKPAERNVDVRIRCY